MEQLSSDRCKRADMDYPNISGSDLVFVFSSDLRKRGTAAQFNLFGYASKEWGTRGLSLSFSDSSS